MQVEDLSVAGARLGEAVRLATGDVVLQQRIATAAPIYALANSSTDILAHTQLLDPLCDFDRVRLRARPAGDAGVWHLVVCALDRPGLLARFTGVLLHHRIDVEHAVLATWDDGAALQALRVRADAAPDVAALQGALEASLTEGVHALPVTDAVVRFDESDKTIFTSCEVSAKDQPGLLHAIAVAISAADANIHSATVRTVDDVARDLFDLSDPDNRKLSPEVSAAIEAILRSGFSS